MSDPPEQTSCHEPGDVRLLRLVPEHELKRLQARMDHLSKMVEELEDENRLLRVEVASLERKLDQKEHQRQQLIDNYERILAKKERDGDTPDESDRMSLTGILFGRSGDE